MKNYYEALLQVLDRADRFCSSRVRALCAIVLGKPLVFGTKIIIENQTIALALQRGDSWAMKDAFIVLEDAVITGNHFVLRQDWQETEKL